MTACMSDPTNTTLMAFRKHTGPAMVKNRAVVRSGGGAVGTRANAGRVKEASDESGDAVSRVVAGPFTD